MDKVGEIPTQLATGHEVSDVYVNGLLKQGIWLYFILLIFEGALRKWVLPGLSTPLLVVRDPIALLLVLSAWYRGLLPNTIYLQGMVLIGLTAFVTAMVIGHENVWVALFGARILLLHLPLVFVIGRVFTRDDVLSVGKFTLWLAIPMAILISYQFLSPQSAWVNRGVGGSLEGAGFSGAMGFFRPPGTFSFTSGNTLFFAFTAAFISYFWLQRKDINLLVLLGATLALLIAIPLSISRGLFFHVTVSLAFMVLASITKPKFFSRILITLTGATFLMIILSGADLFETAIKVFTARFISANESEGGVEGVIVGRYFGGLWEELAGSGSDNSPFFGHGLGMGTNVGSALLTGGVQYLIDEGEWGRIIGEIGPLMGLMFIFLRVGLCARICLAAYSRIKSSDVLPWMLASFGILVLPQGQLGQPTSLGFCTMIGGLMLASLRRKRH